MNEAMHPAAPHHLAWFIVHPSQTDMLMTGAAVFLLILIFIMGVIYFSLHNLPERFAHGTSKLQFELVAVLSLLALFTHIYAFWIAALLLAIIPIPDFWTPLSNMAASLAKIANGRLSTTIDPDNASLPLAPAHGGERAEGTTQNLSPVEATPGLPPSVPSATGQRDDT